MGNVYRSKGHEETIRMLDQWEWEAKVRKEIEEAYEEANNEMTFFIVVKHGKKGDIGGQYNGHVFLLIDGVDYSFRPTQTRNGENLPSKEDGANYLWHSDGWVGSDPAYLNYAKSIDHTVFQVTTTMEKYQSLMENIKNSMTNPPDYRFIGTRFAGWAMGMMRESGIVGFMTYMNKQKFVTKF